MSARTSAILALRAAIRAALVADGDLTGLLGGAFVWDEPPAGAQPPFVTFGEALARPWRDGPGGLAHRCTLVAASAEAGDAQALAIAHRLAARLDDAALPLDGHRLVLLRVAGTRVGRPDRQGLRRAVVTLEALTESA